jgi:hypothetical protein
MQSSYVGHRWELIDADGTMVLGYVVEDEGDVVTPCG